MEREKLTTKAPSIILQCLGLGAIIGVYALLKK